MAREAGGSGTGVRCPAARGFNWPAEGSCEVSRGREQPRVRDPAKC